MSVWYTGGKKKLPSTENPTLSPASITSPVQTTQIAPTILTALGLDPNSLQAVRMEHTQVLPALFAVMASGDSNSGDSDSCAIEPNHRPHGHASVWLLLPVAALLRFRR